MSVNHPKLVNSDSQSIRIFLLRYYQHVNELTVQAQKLVTSPEAITTEPIKAVKLKFCVDTEWLESCIHALP